MAESQGILAVGRWAADGAWVALRRSDGRWDLVFGDPDGSVALEAPAGKPDRPGLVAAAMAYFSEALTDPPPAFEATQADLAELIGWLAETEPDAEAAARLREALEAVDDGLPGDVVASRLAAVKANEQIDPIDLLVEMHRAREARP
jgi:hypothetical protein